MEERLIEVASFPGPNDADVLESLFQKENIDYLMENANSASVIPGIDVKLMVRENDFRRSVELIKKAGYESYLSQSEVD